MSASIAAVEQFALAIGHYEAGRLVEAEALFKEICAANPDHVESLHFLGLIAFQRGHTDAAVDLIEQALALKPDYFEAHYNLGIILRQQGKLDEAAARLRQAVALRPDYLDAHKNLAAMRSEQGKFAEAIVSFERALALAPQDAELKFALCMAQLPVIYTDEAEITRQRAAYEKHLRALCDDADRGALRGDVASGIGLHRPFFLAYQGRNDRDLQRLYGSLLCGILAKRYPPAVLARPPAPDEPVRVGIVSGFFWWHSVWKMPIQGWLSQLDRRRFRVFAYHTASRADSATKTAADLADRFVQGPLSADDWRQTIIDDAPHVLIYPDVGMDAMSAALAAQRLAPVQCTSWGHPETSGFPTLDYFLSSDLMESPDGEDHYTERLIRLPNLSVYYEPLAVSPAAVDRAGLGLRSGATLFWCGQSLYKYLPQYDQVFPRIAREAGDCQFIFVQHPSSRYVNEVFWQRLERAFAAHDLSAADHCVMLPQLSTPSFIAAMGQCDVFLDSIGWSGCNSTLESLNHDLPIVTMEGTLMRGRHTAAILKMMGVTETITETMENYISTAIRLARDVPWRAAVKSRIAANKHRLYRDRACVAALEEFLDRVARQGAGAP
jgi:predicted O-linked N-acetylglucosamine transferase (SPINDLY family)